jgi:hypothetical protein
MLAAVVLAQEISVTEPLRGDDGTDRDPVRERRFGVASASLGFRYGTSTDHGTGTAPWSGYAIAFGADARGLWGKRVGYAFGLGFRAGGVVPQGVDGAFDLLPLGFGVALPRMGFVSLVGGLRAAFSSYDPYALLLFPVELRAEIDLSRRVRLILAGELDFSTVGRGRIPGTDGFSALVALRWGRNGGRDSMQARGRYVGLSMWELRGVPFFGFVLGVEASFGG